ncbi:hypothetical protein JNW88_15680 [Micromonospora sp. ATA32]|nr:hypothetical protein [Micromonospora sp. ATA32]
MSAMAFINLPVRDLARASEFFAALGFTGPPPAPDGVTISVQCRSKSSPVIRPT